MTPRRPIRIGNCSGAINDGIDQIYRLAKYGNVDAITADYLAEFNIAWKAIELQTRPELGFEPNFLEQLAWHGGDAARLVAEKRIKIVHDGGALNPRGLAERTDAYFRSLGIGDVKVAWVGGDNVTEAVKRGAFGRVMHLDQPGVEFDPRAEGAGGEEALLAANAYTGYAGIVRALEAGADIVVCGRCTDASPVMGLARWWHGWTGTAYDALAASLMAGHLIECGPYVTGGNYCGQREVPNLHHAGFPIAEIAADGAVVITKPEGSNGLVSVDTCKAQLLYEIQGSFYLNPDVIADIENAKFSQISKGRIQLSGIRGLPPPPTAKLAICLLGGFQAEISAYAAGLDTDFKFEVLKSQVMGQISQSDFTTFSIEKYGSAATNPRSQKAATVQFRMFAQSHKKEAFEQFKRAVFYNGLQGYCGLHLGMDWRTMEPRPFVRYFPALIPQSKIPLSVSFVKGLENITVEARQETDCGSIPRQHDYDPPTPLTKVSPSQTSKRPLGDLVFARSGDKGGNANIGFWKFIELLGDDWQGRYVMASSDVPVKNASGRYDNVDFRKAAGYQHPPIKCSYNRRDVLLFANAIGVKKDELHFLYELHPHFAAFPTFPINLAFKQTDQDVFDFIARTTSGQVPGVPPFDAQRSVDGERGIEIIRPIPVSSAGLDLEVRNKVIGVYDKGGAMILEAEQLLVDKNTETVYTKMTSTAFGIGQGGYGGPRGPAKQAVTPPDRRPDAVHTIKTTPEAALLYRLCGDYNPMHADEAFGQRAGFKGSILHGLGTWNMAAHGLLQKLGDSDPNRFKAYGARFKSVVYPGDTLETRMWVVKTEGGMDDVIFETVVKEDGRVALSNGYAKIANAKVKL
ncbi:Peroxisomal multifunctional enzyme type 2 [Colletotrichum gloeosporioides]|uniref:Peroxisomal multifunctional enzyme type 2 n=1 Tax=Colletotrichum gloeosporioides TaxID=474922 RepID=A0A8H4C9V0_COLGL|nr:Peroxisomal multifunctional enzyme type 2 [Colletotrichum gloeosporioides]KAF3800051.1 Peroxisomal multifunctional enzyme type 2 [Colletotrichum gloeosporioides]